MGSPIGGNFGFFKGFGKAIGHALDSVGVQFSLMLGGGLPLYIKVKYTDYDKVNDYWNIDTNTPIAAHLETAGTFTCVNYFRFPSGSTGNQWMCAAWGSTTARQRLLLGIRSAGDVQFFLRQPDLSAQSWRSLNGQFNFNNTNWHQLIAKFNSVTGEATAFIDGVELPMFTDTFAVGGKMAPLNGYSVLSLGGLGASGYTMNYDHSYVAWYSDYKSDADCIEMWNGGDVVEPSHYPNLIALMDSNNAVGNPNVFKDTFAVGNYSKSVNTTSTFIKPI